MPKHNTASIFERSPIYAYHNKYKIALFEGRKGKEKELVRRITCEQNSVDTGLVQKHFHWVQRFI